MDMNNIFDSIPSMGFPIAITLGLLQYCKQYISKTIQGYEERAKEYKRESSKREHNIYEQSVRREEIIREDNSKREQLLLNQLEEYKTTCDKLNATNEEVAKTNRILAEEIQKELASSRNAIEHIQEDVRTLGSKIDKLGYK